MDTELISWVSGLARTINLAQCSTNILRKTDPLDVFVTKMMNEKQSLKIKSGEKQTEI